MKPYLLAIDSRNAPGSQFQGGKGVLFALLPTTKSKTLFATCRHLWVPGITTSFFAHTEEGAPLGDLEAKLLPLQGTSLDLMFWEVSTVVPAERMRVNEWPIQKGTIISHAQNVLRKPEFPEGKVFRESVTQTEQRSDKAVRMQGKFFYAPDKQSLDEAKALKVPLYSVLEMQSWPGVSGSPLWDNFGTIRGMVCGGDEEPVSEGVPPRLIYLPVKTILKEAHKMVKAIKAGLIQSVG